MNTPTSPALMPPSRPDSALDARSRQLRAQIVRMLAAARRGHLASAFSLVEILRVLYDEVLRYDPQQPEWTERDRLILSKGHGCMALWVLLAEKGFYPESELWQFCKAKGILGGHPEYGKVPGVEASTGALGHGLSLGIGRALALRQAGSSARVFVVNSDGECNEGSTWEAALSAAKHRLDSLTVVMDCNHMQSYASTREVLDLEPLADKWRAFGFEVREVDGHDVQALGKHLSQLPFQAGKPSLLIAHTVKGKGVSFTEGDLSWHHKNKISDDEVAALLAELEV